MLRCFQRLWGALTAQKDETRDNAATAVVNALTGTTYKTPVTVKHAQLMDDFGNIRLYTSDGREFHVMVNELPR